MQARARTRAWLIYSAVLILMLSWLGALWAAPLLLYSGHGWAALMLYRGFALICHQRPERSFQWCGSPLAVCVRCTGIYAGATFGLLLYPWWQSQFKKGLLARRHLFGALALLLLDWVFGAVGWVHNNVVSRLVTGWLLGVVLMLYLFPLLLRGNYLIPMKFKREGD